MTRMPNDFSGTPDIPGPMGGVNRRLDDDVASTNLNADETGEIVRQLNSLLRGESSAAETYRMAIEKLGDSDKAATTSVGLLRQMQEEHGRAAQALRDR